MFSLFSFPFFFLSISFPFIPFFTPSASPLVFNTLAFLPIFKPLPTFLPVFLPFSQFFCLSSSIYYPIVFFYILFFYALQSFFSCLHPFCLSYFLLLLLSLLFFSFLSSSLPSFSPFFLFLLSFFSSSSSFSFFLSSFFLFSFASSASYFFFFLSFFPHCSLSLYSLLPCAPFLNLLPSNFSVITSFLHFILTSIHLFTQQLLISPLSP